MDMYDEILKFGSLIVDSLRGYQQPVFVYLPPHATLRGGAWVVVDSTINEQCECCFCVCVRESVCISVWYIYQYLYLPSQAQSSDFPVDLKGKIKKGYPR